MNSYSRVYASIDLDAVESNMRAMKDSLPPSASMIGVVKTDGYGHGAVPVARTIDPYVEGDAVAAGHHVIRGLDFLPGHDQPEDREQHQIGADRNNVSHIFSFSSHNRIIKRFYSFRGIMSSCIPSGVCAGIRTRQFFSGFLSKSVVSCPRGERHDIQGCGEPHH